jgi:hypothetical protein
MTTTENVKPPLCSRCGNRMSVAFVVPHKPGREPRTHKCPVCGNIETVEIAKGDQSSALGLLRGTCCGALAFLCPAVRSHVGSEHDDMASVGIVDAA